MKIQDMIEHILFVIFALFMVTLGGLARANSFPPTRMLAL